MQEKMRNYLIAGLLLMVIVVAGCAESPIYANDVVYDCKSGEYSFPSTEPTFAKVNVYLIDFENLKENKCALSLDYKVKFKPTGNPYYEIDVDTCTLTMSQLASLKEKNADLTTMLRYAKCDENTNVFLPTTSTVAAVPDSAGQATSELNNSLKEVGLTQESARALLLQIGQDAPLDQCRQNANEVACLSAAWEYAFRKGIPKGQEIACELVKTEEIKALCKSGVGKNLPELEQEFDNYVN
jgi:hypothetical protein